MMNLYSIKRLLVLLILCSIVLPGCSTAIKPDVKETQLVIKDEVSSTEKDIKEIKSEVLESEVEIKKQTLDQLWKARINNRSLTRKWIVFFVIIFISLLLYFFLDFTLKKFEDKISTKGTIRESDRVLRIKTLNKLFRWVSVIVLLGITTLLSLANFGFDITFMFAGAGIVGVALGFGGQYLIRDIINGIFVILEGQYRIDDVIQIAGERGLVEDINLRTTTLRDLEGRVIVIPNGEIKTVINFTKEYSQAVLNIGVAYKENVDRVMEIIKDIGKEMRKDEHFKHLILEDLEMFGVDDLADSQVTIKFRIKTLPIKQWDIEREMRRRIKNRFDELGIEIPLTHRTLYMGTGKSNE